MHKGMAALAFCWFVLGATLIQLVAAVPVNSVRLSSIPQRDSGPARLRFNSDGSFRIIQLADLHFGEAPDSWGPQQDALSIKYIKAVMAAETVDLAVLTGDQLSAAGIDTNATDYWDMIVDTLQGTPHTAILGNHDAEPPHANGQNQSKPELLPAVSIYVVDVWPEDPQVDVPELQLVHLDSGGGGMEEEVYLQQITWFNATMRKRRERFGRAVPALVFVHIPLWEFEHAMQHDACVGEQDEGVTPTVHNTGLFAAVEANREVIGVFVGHDHCNDFCCKVGSRGVNLCFGRHTGDGGYQCNGYVNGARVIEVQARPWHVTTHVRLVNGSVVHAAAL